MWKKQGWLLWLGKCIWAVWRASYTETRASRGLRRVQGHRDGNSKTSYFLALILATRQTGTHNIWCGNINWCNVFGGQLSSLIINSKCTCSKTEQFNFQSILEIYTHKNMQCGGLYVEKEGRKRGEEEERKKPSVKYQSHEGTSMPQNDAAIKKNEAGLIHWYKKPFKI